MDRARFIAALLTSPRRTSGYAAAVSLITSFAVLLSGCRTPYYVCNRGKPSPPPILNVKLDDQRPKWERKFYLGGAYEDITFIPVERICPTPMEQFRERLEARFEGLGVRPADVSFRVISCRVVVNSDAGHTDHLELAKLDYFGDKHRRVPSAKDDWTQHVHYTAYGSTDPYGRPLNNGQEDDDFGAEVLGLGLIVGGITAYFAAIGTAFVTYEGTRNVAHWLHLRPGYPGPPKKLDTAVYPAGTTFELYGDLQVTLPSGETRVVPVRQKNTVPAPHNPGTESVKTAVGIGTDQAAEKATREVLGLPALETTPPPALEPNAPPAGFAPIPPQQPAVSLSGGGASASVSEETRRIQEAQRQQFDEVHRGALQPQR